MADDLLRSAKDINNDSLQSNVFQMVNSESIKTCHNNAIQLTPKKVAKRGKKRKRTLIIKEPAQKKESLKKLYKIFKDEQLYHANTPNQLPNNMKKYWNQRHILYSKYDDGILLDTESWFSVTPEPIASHVAKRFRGKVILDPFCGSGGNAIQFALNSNFVIAIDIDPVKIKIAQNNARIYNVENRIEFINGDFTKLAKHLKADIIYLSPPWGGVEYIKNSVYDLSMIMPIGGKEIFGLASKITPDIIYFVPKNSDPDQ
ncbi:hypothetical protein BB560_004711, partial [Smittium megazygosporum]